MVREDLVSGAVSFLQDPSVASAPVDQRVAFLRSKNLTQEEIDLSLQRLGADPSISSPPPASQSPQAYNYQQRQSPQQYGGYQNGYWQQPPPELPRRDWRDWFIMATVLGGVSYGVYFVAKQYVLPLIAPPTPPQLEQDKASIDSSFEKAFALLDQLATDTAELKTSEKTRTERLDAALSEVEAVIGQMKDASRRRDDEGRRIGDEVRALKDMIPKALDAQRDTIDSRLKDLASEIKSLKTLISNRVAPPRQTPSSGPYSPQATVNGANSTPQAQPFTAVASDPAPEQLDAPKEDRYLGPTPDRASTSSPYGRMMNGRAAIPAWQMAAAKKNQEVKDTSESGTAVPGVDGAAILDAAQ